jgi:hypothetical protein
MRRPANTQMRTRDAYKQELAETTARHNAATPATALVAVARRRARDGLPHRRVRVSGRNREHGSARGRVRCDRAAELRATWG